MNRRPWRPRLVTTVLLLCGCAGSSSAVIGALVNTSIAVGASAVSRSQGGCYASCPPGTTCNGKTGYCDPLPCRGECASFEECIEDRLTYRCVVRNPGNGNILVQPPADTPTSQEPRSSEPAP